LFNTTKRVLFGGGNMKILFRVLAFVALVIAGVWLYFDRSLEPLFTTIAALGALIGSFVVENGSISIKKTKVVYKGKSKHKGDNNF